MQLPQPTAPRLAQRGIIPLHHCGVWQKLNRHLKTKKRCRGNGCTAVARVARKKAPIDILPDPAKTINLWELTISICAFKLGKSSIKFRTGAAMSHQELTIQEREMAQEVIAAMNVTCEEYGFDRNKFAADVLSRVKVLMKSELSDEKIPTSSQFEEQSASTAGQIIRNLGVLLNEQFMEYLTEQTSGE
jgi:hypothetical protein